MVSEKVTLIIPKQGLHNASPARSVRVHHGQVRLAM